MAREISSNKQRRLRFEKLKHSSESEMDVDEEDEGETEDDEAVSTDHDQDDSLDHSSTSGSDDLNMNEDEMRNFDMDSSVTTNSQQLHHSNIRPISKSRIESTINRSLTLKNPGELISDFYISNMNYAMRYSVEHVQKFAKDLRQRREKLDSISSAAHSQEDNQSLNKLNRSFSVDRLYAVRREHIRYSNGADEEFGARNISFTTDDIQDIYMPSSIDNYKRKIAVELERRRRYAENEMTQRKPNRREYSNRGADRSEKLNQESNEMPPIVLDDLDIFLIKKAKSTIEKEGLLNEEAVKSFQPTIQINPAQAVIKRSSHVVISNQPKINSFRKESPIFLDTVDMISREPKLPLTNQILIKKPDVKFKPKSSLKSTFTTDFQQPTSVKLEKANVSIANSLNQYALVNKVSTLVDNEIVPSPSSSSITEEYPSSNETSDSLDNLDLPNFELRNQTFTSQSKMNAKKIIEINKLNRQIENQTAARIEALSSFNQNNPNRQESRRVEKILEQPNNKVNISIIKTFSLADQDQVSPAQSCVEQLEPSLNYTPREANYKIETNGLSKLPTSRDSKIIMLNAPKIKEDTVTVQQVKKLPNSPRVAIQDPEYIIEEFAHKPLDSSIVYSYENAAALKPQEPTLSKLKTSQEIAKAMSFVSINQDEILEDVGYLEPQNEKQNANLSINKHILSKLDAKKEPLQLNAPISNEESIVFGPPPAQFESCDPTSNKASLSHHYDMTLENPAHVLVPVNLKNANENEVEDIQPMEIDPKLSLSLTQTKLKETKQPNETLQSIDWVKTNVFNLAEIKLDSTEANYAHPFEAVHSDDIKQQLSHRESVPTLKMSAQSIVAAVLNSAKQITEQETLNQCKELEVSKLNSSVATQKNEELYLNLKPSIFKIATLNASVKRQASFHDEKTVDELDVQVDQIMISSSVTRSHPNELIKPPISKKPVIINNAKLTETCINPETVINLTSVDSITKQSIKVTKHLSDLNSVENLKIACSISPFHLAQTNKETIEMQRLTEYRPETTSHSEIKLNIVKEASANLKASQCQSNEPICGMGMMKKADEFIESVKPMDTIEINFDESISNQTTQALFSPSQRDNKVNVCVCSCLNRPAWTAEKEENCHEFVLDDHQTESVKSTIETFTSSCVHVRKQPAQLVLPHQSIDSCREERSVPFEVFHDYSEPIVKEETTDLRETSTVVKKCIKKMALGQVNSEQNLEENTKELESIHLSLIEPSAPNKIVETKIDIVRIEKQANPEMILNNPVCNYIQTESVKRFQPEELDYERPKFGIEITEVNEEKKVIRIKMLNSPFYKTEHVEEHRLERLVPIVREGAEQVDSIVLCDDCICKAVHANRAPNLLNSPFYHTEHIEEHRLERLAPNLIEIPDQADSIVLCDDCTCKAVQARQVPNYNMATIKEHSQIEEYIKETKETISSRNLATQIADENQITHLNSFAHGSNDIKKIELNHYGRAQEVIELHSNSCTCDHLEPIRSGLSTCFTTVSSEENIVRESVGINRNQIRNLAKSNQLPGEQCQFLDTSDYPHYSIPIQNTERNTFEETSVRLHKSSVLIEPIYSLGEASQISPMDNQIEIKIINTENDLQEKPDKTLLRWLNYPQSQLNDSIDESTMNVDEKLDYMYDKVNSEKTVISQDLNMVKVEKVLNRIISNTENIQNEYELVQYVTQCRPEIQQLVISSESNFNLNEPQSNQAPVCLKSAKSIEHLIEETTQAEYFSSVHSLKEINEDSLNQSKISKPFVLNSAHQMKSDDQTNTLKVQNMQMQSKNENDSVESLVTTVTYEDKDKYQEHKTESTVIFNLPTIGRLARLDEMSTEFYDHQTKESICKDKKELICINSEKSLLNAPVSNETKANESLNEIKPLNDISVQLEILKEQESKELTTPLQELIAPYMNSYTYVEEKCNNFESAHKESKLQVNKLPEQIKQVCSLDQQVEWETTRKTSSEMIHKTSEEIVRKVLLKSIIQNELHPIETSKLISHDWSNDLRKVEPISASTHDSVNNLVEKNQPLIENKEILANLNNTDDDIGSFIEQIEKIEVIAENSKFNKANVLESTIQEEYVIHHSSAMIPNESRLLFNIEKEKINKLVEKIEVPKWEEPIQMEEPACLEKLKLNESFVVTNVNDFSSSKTVVLEEQPSVVLNETIQDEDLSLSEDQSVNSSVSSKIHLIESVEIVTHHDREENLNESRQSEKDKQVHIHKVDINRLQIREKSPRKYKDLDEKSRFKVDFKQEEVMDLRDLRENNNGIDTNETFEQNGSSEMTSDKIFARKFVDQIVRLSTSKLADFEAQHQMKSIEDYDDSVMKYETLNFNQIATNSSSQILESLNNLKINIGKHLTDTIAGNYNPENINKSPSKSSKQLKNSFYDDDNDSLKEAREDFFENFDNRLHSTYNHGHNSTIINSSIDTEDYFSEKFEEEIEIIKESNSSNFQIPIHIEYEFNDQSFSNKKKVRLNFRL